MPDLMHDSGIELNREDFQFTDGYEQPLLTEGQAGCDLRRNPGGSDRNGHQHVYPRPLSGLSGGIK